MCWELGSPQLVFYFLLEAFFGLWLWWGFCFLGFFLVGWFLLFVLCWVFFLHIIKIWHICEEFWWVFCITGLLPLCNSQCNGKVGLRSSKKWPKPSSPLPCVHRWISSKKSSHNFLLLIPSQPSLWCRPSNTGIGLLAPGVSRTSQHPGDIFWRDLPITSHNPLPHKPTEFRQ